MGVISALCVSGDTGGILLYERGGCTSAFGQKVIDVIGVGIVTVGVRAGRILSFPFGRPAGVEEQCAVGLSIERNLGEVVIKIFDVGFRKEGEVIAI